ncbi:unnamed protein product [Coccothraustes coccothraustes]
MLIYYGNAPQTAGVRGPALPREGRSSLGKRSGNRDGRSNTDSVTYISVAVAVTREMIPQRPLAGHHGGCGTPTPSRDPAGPGHRHTRGCARRQEPKRLLNRTSQALNIRQSRRLNRLFSFKSLHAAFEMPHPDSVVWFQIFKIISTNDLVVQKVCWASTS